MKKTALITIICVALVLVNIVESFGQSKLNHVIHETTISSNLSNCQVYASSTDLSRPITISFVITSQKPESTTVKNSIANGVVSLFIPESAEVDYGRIVVYGGKEAESTTLERFNPDNNTDKLWTSIAGYLLSWTPIGPVIGTGDFMQQMDEIIRSNGQEKPKFNMNEYDQINIPFDPPFNKYAKIQVDFMVSFANNTEVGVGANWEVLGHDNSGQLLSDPKDYTGVCFDKIEINKRDSQESGRFTDSRDDHVYTWVRIDNQTWMAENLAYLPSVNNTNDFSDTSPRYYVYGFEGNSPNSAKSTYNYKTYGVLYNGISAQRACPPNWHLPSDEEWQILMRKFFLKLRPDAILGSRRIVKWKDHVSPSDWSKEYYNDATNSSGLSVLPAGLFNSNGDNSHKFEYLGRQTFIWTSTQGTPDKGHPRNLAYITGGTYSGEYNLWDGFSVRCIRD